MYYELTGNDDITHILTTNLAAGKLVLNGNGEYQYKVAASCLCQVIKRFACFSSALNCIIVKKGSDTCSQ